MSIPAADERALFFNTLRTRTSDYHDKLESTPLSVSIVSDTLQKPQYAQYLKTMYAYVKPFEKSYFPLLEPVFSTLRKRSRVAALETDLHALGMSREALDSIETVQLDATQVSLPEAVGAMYVLEGSSLGGRVILKKVQKSMNLGEENGALYFAGYGAETGTNWKQFLDELWGYAENTGSAEEIYAGAVKAFADMYTLFSKEDLYAL